MKSRFGIDIITKKKNLETSAKYILDEIIKAGSIHFRGKISLLGSVINLDVAITHFSQAMVTVFDKHSFSNEYHKLRDSEKAIMHAMVAQHFIKKYGDSNNIYNLLYLKYYKNYFKGIYLLGDIFGVRLRATDANIKNTLVKEIDFSLKKSIADILHQNRILTLARGYTDHHSIFSTLPKELINHIGQATNAIYILNKKI